MVRPTHFDVKYSINPYMNVNVKVDRERAMEQWTRLKALIEAEGRKVSCASKNVLSSNRIEPFS